MVRASISVNLALSLMTNLRLTKGRFASRGSALFLCVAIERNDEAGMGRGSVVGPSRR